MNKLSYRAFFVSLFIIFSVTLPASALAAAYPELEEHWGYKEMTYAIDKGYLTGFEDGTIRPDDDITGAEAVTLICRMLDARTAGSSTGLGLTGEEWYAEAAQKAQHLGLISSPTDLRSPLSRLSAFTMIAEAFQLYGADIDNSALDGFGDAASLSSHEKNCVAALINSGYVQGYDGSLSLSAPLTRAEFAALLYRLTETSAILSDGVLSDWTGNTLWLSCSSGNAKLRNVTAERVVIRSQELNSIHLSGCNIDELVIAGDGDLQLNPRGVNTVRIGSGSGTITVMGNTQSLEITGSHRQITLSEDVHNITISGDKNTVTLENGVKCSELTVTGTGNTATVNGTLKNANILGPETTLDGRGAIENVYLRAPSCNITQLAKTLTDATDYGIYGSSATLRHPELLPAGETLTVTASVQNANAGPTCQAEWYIDGTLVSSAPVALGELSTFTLNHDYFYTRGMSLESKIEFKLSYTTEYGEQQSVSAGYIQPLENYPEDHLFTMDIERVLDLVTSDYAGDFTLDWALSHDYEPYEKEIWVNAQDYSSDTQYLIWINQSCQRVNIFEGAQGEWKLIYEYIVGCGRESNTPKGVFKTTYNQTGWFTPSYDVRPVVRFKGGGYAFHSRLYHPGTNELQDAGIGYPISAGCIRMYDGDIQWIYDNVPTDTTVVVH